MSVISCLLSIVGIDPSLLQDAKSGLFEKKWLILAILDGDKPSKSGKDPPLGRVVINLADYVADDDRATMAFTVAANQAISAQVGECKLLVTLGYCNKGISACLAFSKTIFWWREKFTRLSKMCRSDLQLHAYLKDCTRLAMKALIFREYLVGLPLSVEAHKDKLKTCYRHAGAGARASLPCL